MIEFTDARLPEGKASMSTRSRACGLTANEQRNKSAQDLSRMRISEDDNSEVGSSEDGRDRL